MEERKYLAKSLRKDINLENSRVMILATNFIQDILGLRHCSNLCNNPSSYPRHEIRGLVGFLLLVNLHHTLRLRRDYKHEQV